jgi:recombination protein RecR
VRLVQLLIDVSEKQHFSVICGSVAEEPTCQIGRDLRLPPMNTADVEEVEDLFASGRTMEFCGSTHLLGGAISPIDGIRAGGLRIAQLLGRLGDGSGAEAVIPTAPDIEGKARAAYLTRLFVVPGPTVPPPVPPPSVRGAVTEWPRRFGLARHSSLQRCRRRIMTSACERLE